MTVRVSKRKNRYPSAIKDTLKFKTKKLSRFQIYLSQTVAKKSDVRVFIRVKSDLRERYFIKRKKKSFQFLGGESREIKAQFSVFWEPGSISYHQIHKPLQFHPP